MKRIYTLSRTAFVLICICLFLVITAQAQQEQAAEPAQAQQEQAAEPAQTQQEQAAEPAQAQQETAVLEVESAAICEDVVDREPVGAGDSFSVSMEKLFWSEMYQRMLEIPMSIAGAYAMLDRDDPLRQTAMTAAFLRASLFTSVVSFGVALMAAGIGLVLLFTGWALLALNRADRFEVVAEKDGA